MAVKAVTYNKWRFFYALNGDGGINLHGINWQNITKQLCL